MVFFDPSGIRKFVFFAIISLTATLVAGSLFISNEYLKSARILAPATHAPINWEDPAFEKTLTLTFDDGPHGTYTPELLEILEENQVPATFFLIGENMVRHPIVTQNIVESGFQIGNHSLTHSHNVHATSERVKRELVTTDRIIATLTGHSTVFYRPPFLLDEDFGEVEGYSVDGSILQTIEDLGLIVVGADAGGEDWMTISRTDAGSVYQELVLDTLEGGHIILLHDAAGNGATVDALRAFIPRMKAEGYTFVPLSYYFGMTPEQAMPQIDAGTILSESILTTLLFVEVTGGAILQMLVLLMIVLAIARIWAIILMRRTVVPFVRKRRPELLPSSSVIIPAYNESANIEATIQSIIAGSVLPREILVVDDASSDNTAHLVERLQESVGSRLKLIRQKEKGWSKANVLNAGIPHGSGDILVCIDADTILEYHALQRLLERFDSPEIGAVAGKVYPASLRSFFEKLQYLEYVQAQNLDKEVFSALKAVNVVPGATGAWRKSAVVNAGGYSNDTVVEDQDLTLMLLLRGWDVVYEPRAVGYTETPATARSFFRQRFRWVHGTMQCFRKYEQWFGSVREYRIGFVVLPQLLIFNLLIPLAAPLIDVTFALGLFGLVDIPVLFATIVLFLLLDFYYAYEGLRLEARPQYRLLIYIPLQRWVYRYIVAAATVKSVFVALAGTLVLWSSPLRRGAAKRAWTLAENHSNVIR